MTDPTVPRLRRLHEWLPLSLSLPLSGKGGAIRNAWIVALLALLLVKGVVDFLHRPGSSVPCTAADIKAGPVFDSKAGSLLDSKAGSLLDSKAGSLFVPVQADWSAVKPPLSKKAAGEAFSGEPFLSQSGISRQQRSFSATSRKWIVVTSVNPPSAAIGRMVAASAAGWQLVVVGDVKSPKNWSRDGAIFLSVKEQARLGFEILSLIPYNSYARKNIGYLYAIQHGAEVIYDTDDDNILLESNEAEMGFLTQGMPPKGALEYLPGRECVNPYVHFGQPTMWPRGLPLDAVADNFPEEHYLSAESSLKPLIQQGLANGDPDVDAIFRLTRATKGRKIRVSFDSQAPPVALPVGTMAPINSQNTLFLRDALWALRIPITTSFRVCDIWRGYWAQRLLWDVGGNLLFLPPTVLQKRNVHDYFEDFIQEEVMYRETQRLIRFLLDWKSNKALFFDRALDLANDMVLQGFWGPQDAYLTAAWLRDLIRVGYSQPLIINRPIDERAKREVIRYSAKVMNSTSLKKGPRNTRVEAASPPTQGQ